MRLVVFLGSKCLAGAILNGEIDDEAKFESLLTVAGEEYVV